MKDAHICVLPGCGCLADGDETFCSEYCRQAASHAPERDYCQCGHSGCSLGCSGHGAMSVHATPAIRFDPGQVTIQYSSLEQLSEQLRLLAAALLEHSDIPTAGGPARRPAASETRSPSAKARHA